MRQILSVFLLFLLALNASAKTDSTVDGLGSPNDKKLLSTSEYVTGGILGIFPGFGLGHVVQGRYREKGYLYTLAPVAAFGAIVITEASFCGLNGGNSTCVDNISTIGIATFVGLKIWEVYDVWVVPGYAVGNLENQKTLNKQKAAIVPYFLPLSGRQVIAGITFGF
jgi:hypothetical protein